MTELLTVDRPSDDMVEEWHYDHANNTVTIVRRQEVDPIIEKVAQIQSAGGHQVDGLGNFVGEIPITVIQDWAQRRGIPWEAMAYGNAYNDELIALIKEYTKLSPSGGKV